MPKNNKITNNKAIIYTRVASMDQSADHKSLQAQEDACRKYALENDLEIVKVFFDQGVSGMSQDRPGLNDLIDFVDKNKDKVSAIIVSRIDRITRDRSHFAEIGALCHIQGVRICSALGGDNPESEFIQNILLSMSKFQSAMRSKSIKRGIAAAKKNKA